jgi:ribosomal protein L35AE/L33A
VAYAVSYRRGSNSQNERYVLLEIEGVRSDSEAARFVGRKVLWKSPDGKLTVKGVIVRVSRLQGAGGSEVPKTPTGPGHRDASRDPVGSGARRLNPKCSFKAFSINAETLISHLFRQFCR